MARGTVVGEAVVSQANNESFRQNYDQIDWGERKGPKRGRFVATPTGAVPADEYVPPAEARNAPIMVDRFYEGASFNDGTRTVDLGSRRKHREFMREKGWTVASDYTQTWKKAEERRERVKSGELPSATRREALARAMYQIDKP